MLEWGSAAQNQIELRREIRPLLKELTDRTGETSNFVLINEHGLVFIDNVESVQNIRPLSRIGRQPQLHTTATGKVSLAFLPDKEVKQLLTKIDWKLPTPKTISSMEELKVELNKIRQQGYAVDDEECEIGARCIAVPIWDHSGKVIGALSISGPISRIAFKDVSRIASIVKEFADQASIIAGYKYIATESDL